MREQVAVRRPTSQEAPEIDGDRTSASRPAGRRLSLLVLLACASVAMLGARSAQSLAAGLPDNRGYEMVSPATKDGEVEHLVIIGGDQAAPDGNSVGYVALSPFPGGGPGIDDLATRGPNGWTSQNLLPPQAPGVTLALPGYVLYSTDLSKALLSNGGATISGASGQDFPFLDPGSCTTALFPSPPPTAATPCTGEAVGRPNLFVRNDTNGSFSLVDSFANAPAGTTPQADTGSAAVGASADMSTVVFTDDAVLTPGATFGDSNLYAENGGTVTLLGDGASLGGPGFPGRVLHAVSDDGSRIFVTDAAGNLGEFHPGSTSPTLIAPTQNGSSPAFMTASSDGSVVFFTDADAAALTGDTVSGSGTNLYEWNGSTITNLTPGHSQVQVDGVVGASSDGSVVYFVAEGVLASGATANAENLYVDQNGTTKFVATLNANDGSDWNGQATARVTPDGMHLAFNSSDPTLAQTVDSFDNTDATSGNPDTEVYLYSAGTGSLVCASCNAAHNPPIGSSTLDPVEGGILNGGGMYLQHNLSDDGSRVFFDSSDALVPTDTNGQPDVYEYENGQDSLISSGRSDDASLFYDASANGSDVFFVTRDQLVPQDTDGQQDLYDARVNGGFPAPPPLPPCTGDSCKPGTTAPPAPPTIATVTFFGPGNPTPTSPKVPPKATVKFSTKAIKGFKFVIKVRVPAKGTVTISGHGLKSVNRFLRGGRTYKFTIGLTTAQRKALKKKHKGRLKIKVHIVYRETGGSSSANVPVTVKA